MSARVRARSISGPALTLVRRLSSGAAAWLIERLALARDVAMQFAVSGPLHVSDFLQKGNINYQTFTVDERAPGQSRRFLLQRINEDVFTRPRSVMAAMLACLDAQQANLERGRLQPGEQWEPVTLVPHA